MEVDEGLSVRDGVTDIGTRTNQEEPRSSIAPLGADVHPRRGERAILEREDGSRVVDSKSRQVNQDNPRGDGHKPFCGRRRYGQRYASEPGRAKEFNRPPEGGRTPSTRRGVYSTGTTDLELS